MQPFVKPEEKFAALRWEILTQPIAADAGIARRIERRVDTVHEHKPIDKADTATVTLRALLCIFLRSAGEKSDYRALQSPQLRVTDVLSRVDHLLLIEWSFLYSLHNRINEAIELFDHSRR